MDFVVIIIFFLFYFNSEGKGGSYLLIGVLVKDIISFFLPLF